MELNTILYLSILIFSGLVFGKLAKLVKLPNVTGYLVAGLLVGPSVLGIIPEAALSGFDIISEVALGFIAFSIGSEFKLSYFKKVGIAPVIIAIFEALLAVAAVVIGLLIAGFDLSFSLVLGSIAAATAPAATIMVVKQYKAKGPLTETLMSVVALDDAVALMAFGFAVTAAKAMNSGGDTDLLMSILSPFIEIFGSKLLVGDVVVCDSVRRVDNSLAQVADAVEQLILLATKQSRTFATETHVEVTVDVEHLAIERHISACRCDGACDSDNFIAQIQWVGNHLLCVARHPLRTSGVVAHLECTCGNECSVVVEEVDICRNELLVDGFVVVDKGDDSTF